jgi:hypothetical protein
MMNYNFHQLMIDYIDMLMDNHNYRSIERDLKEISNEIKNYRDKKINGDFSFFYFIKFFKWFIEVNKSNN